jgi:hypothetical protein
MRGLSCTAISCVRFLWIRNEETLTWHMRFCVLVSDTAQPCCALTDWRLPVSQSGKVLRCYASLNDDPADAERAVYLTTPDGDAVGGARPHRDRLEI